MREEIIPQMLKTQHLINPDMKIEDIEDLEEFNPEWKKSLDMANEKIRELGELQMEGADTYMGTFAQLKTFPFFQQAAHWFYPFSTQISEVASILPSGNDKGKQPYQTPAGTAYVLQLRQIFFLLHLYDNSTGTAEHRNLTAC